MAALGNATVKSSIVELINSEKVQTRIAPTHEAPRLWRMLCDVRAGQDATVTWPRDNKMALSYSEASGHTETDEVPIVEHTYEETVITPVTIPMRSVISKDAKQDALIDELAQILKGHINRCHAQQGTDAFLNITSASNTADYTGQALDGTKMGAVIATYAALEPTGGPGVFLLGMAQVKHLAAYIRASSSAVYGSAFGGQMAGTVLQGNTVGHKGNYEGFELFQSSQTPAYNGSNTAGALFSAGDGGAIGVNVWRGIEHDVQYDGTRLCWNIVTDYRSGSGLVEPSNIVEIASANA